LAKDDTVIQERLTLLDEYTTDLRQLQYLKSIPQPQPRIEQHPRAIGLEPVIQAAQSRSL
jgi:hypothetical protein